MFNMTKVHFNLILGKGRYTQKLSKIDIIDIFIFTQNGTIINILNFEFFILIFWVFFFLRVGTYEGADYRLYLSSVYASVLYWY